MASKKRSPIQRERDRAEIADLYLRGRTQYAIADQLNQKYYLTDPISQQQISYDLKVIRERWLKSSLVNFNQARAAELSKIDHLEIEYWQAWERSIKPLRKRKRIDSSLGSSKELAVEQRDGNPAYLAGVQWCIGKRCDILGLLADEHSKIDWRIEVIKLLQAGTVAPEDVLAELGRDLAVELFTSAGVKLQDTQP